MLLQIILAAAVVGIIGVFGAFFGLRFLTKAPERIILTVAFAAGTMICASFLELLPEALKLSGNGQQSAAAILLFAALGFLLFFLMERTWLVYHCHEEHCVEHSSAYMIIIGDTVHNFLDGLAITASFLSAPAVGVMTALAIIAHEIPQEVGDFGVLLHAGFSKAKALFFNLFSAGVGVLGAIIGFYFLQNFQNAAPALLAATAGGFIYIGAADLLPQTHRQASRGLMVKRTAAFLSGMILLWLVGLFIHE